MTWFDYIVLVIFVVSIGIGWWRGLSYEVVSLVGWVAAYWVARNYESSAVVWVPDAVKLEWMRAAIAYAALFLMMLLVSALLGWFLSRLIQFSGLGILNSLMGAVFGALRGVMIVLVLVWLAGLTDLPKKAFWREAKSSAFWQKLAVSELDVLPKDIAKKISY